jgi:hypothetical protein
MVIISGFEYLLAYTRTTEELANNILQTLSRLKSIHPGLWEKKIIWSQSFITRLEVLYKRRENFCMNYSDLCKHLSVKCQQKYTSEGETVNRNTHTILEDTILEDSIGENTSLHAKMRELFQVYYLDKKGIEYYWQAKDGAALKRIITKLKKATGDKEKIPEAWKIILQYNSDKWIIDHLSVSILDSKYNEIVAKIKNTVTGDASIRNEVTELLNQQ